jgi:hypothetical protein
MVCWDRATQNFDFTWKIKGKYLVSNGARTYKTLPGKGRKILWTDKEFAHIGFKFADLNGLSQRFNKGKKLGGKHWVRKYCKRYGLALRATEWCSYGGFTGYKITQCQ